MSPSLGGGLFRAASEKTDVASTDDHLKSKGEAEPQHFFADADHDANLVVAPARVGDNLHILAERLQRLGSRHGITTPQHEIVGTKEERVDAGNGGDFSTLAIAYGDSICMISNVSSLAVSE